jgi:hypothetical protein
MNRLSELTVASRTTQLNKWELINRLDRVDDYLETMNTANGVWKDTNAVKILMYEIRKLVDNLPDAEMHD